MKLDIQQKVQGLLLVGDMHVKKDNIDESTLLIEWINRMSQENGNLPVVFLGDQYNDFGIAKVEVTDFWKWAYSYIEAPTISLVGNHDANSDMSLNFMTLHADHTYVVDGPTYVGFDQYLLLPFYRKAEEFLDIVNSTPRKPKTIICHQEFNGAQYENGFYAPHGADPTLINGSVERIISGHIHKKQAFERVVYPGTSRHLTRSDIGEEKGVHILKDDTFTFIPTPKEVSEPFVHYEISKGAQTLPIIDSSERVFIDIKGDESFVRKQLKAMPKGAKVRTFVEQETSTVTVKESEGIPKAFFSYYMEYANQNNLGTAETKVILDLIYQKCPSLKAST
jgi:DNA repair exonuclease SbcCD nuclease subunit